MGQRYRPLSQVELEEKLREYAQLLEDVTDDYAEALRDAAKAESAWKKAESSVYLRGKGTQKDREAKARYDTMDLFEEHKAAEAVVKALQARMNAYRETIGALRTLNSNVRAQV
jgi:hypothetical protein